MRMVAGKSIRRAVAVFTATLGLVLGANADELPGGEGVTAVWKIQAVELNFASFDIAYSCSSLQAKIANILGPIVLDQATKVGIHCSNIGMGTSARAKILIASPVEATPENLQALTHFDPRQQLIARVRSMELPTEEDIPRFAASWRRVSLSRGKGLSLNPSDCQLLSSIRDQVLPHLSVKVTRNRSMCGSTTPVLEVEALLPLEPPKLAKAQE